MYEFLLMLILFGNSKSQYFLVVEKSIENSSAGHYYCITNTSSGLSWINENNTNNITTQKASKFISDSHNDVKWNHSIPKPWSLENSLEGKINDVILDRRWETLKVTRTQELAKSLSNTTNLTFLVENKEDDFTVPFSILGDAADIIFLLDVNVHEVIKLYWLNLHITTKFEMMNTLKICSSLQLFTSFCSNLTMTNLPPKLLPSNEEWLHFKITRRENLLMLLQMSGSNYMKVIEYNDTSVSSVRSIVIGELQQKPILLKIHNLKYMLTTNVTENIRFEPAINLDNQSICISMFISICRTCLLKVTLQNADENRRDLPQEKIYPFVKTGWSEINFSVEQMKNRRVLLLISTIKNSSGEGFWSIDQIRQCRRKDELRMITSNEKAKCQLISGHGTISTEELRGDKLFSSSEQFLKNNCSENTIGSICMPCSWIFSESYVLSKFCENYMDGNKKCYSSECKYVAEVITPPPPRTKVTPITTITITDVVVVVVVVIAFVVLVFVVMDISLSNRERIRNRRGNNDIPIPLIAVPNTEEG